MSEDKSRGLDYFFEFLKNNQGLHPHLDEKVLELYMNRDYFKKRIIDSPSSGVQNGAFLQRLTELITQFQSYQDNENHLKARAFLQEVTSELVSTISSKPDPVVLFSDSNNSNNLIHFALENTCTYFIELSFLEEKRIASCSSLNHEIGHCLLREYMVQNGHAQDFIAKINPLLGKLLKKLNWKNKMMEYIASWLMSWIAEFSADGFSVATLGIRGLVNYIEESQHLGIPMFLGTDTHPPLNLRIQFMKTRLLKIVREQGIEDPSLSIIEDWKPTGRNQMPTETFLKSALNDPQFKREGIQKFIDHGRITGIPNKLAFNRQILSTLYCYIDRILQWGGVKPDLQSILRTKKQLLNNTIPDVKSQFIFAALIDISEEEQIVTLENLIRSRTKEN